MRSFLMTRSLHSLFSVLIGATLYSISYFVLWNGYATVLNSESSPMHIDPTVLPCSVIGLLGLWVTRKIRFVPWLWVACLALWTQENVRYYWVGGFFIDGRHGCIRCDASAMLLLFFTPIWIVVALVAWIMHVCIRNDIERGQTRTDANDPGRKSEIR
jgi:putative effector of murein hydrolase LrgA (UPF0299 family)